MLQGHKTVRSMLPQSVYRDTSRAVTLRSRTNESMENLGGDRFCLPWQGIITGKKVCQKHR